MAKRRGMTKDGLIQQLALSMKELIPYAEEKALALLSRGVFTDDETKAEAAVVTVIISIAGSLLNEVEERRKS